jgi:hypothetical protein
MESIKMQAEIRRQIIVVEQIWHEKGPCLAKPVRRGWAGVVVANPFADRYVENLIAFMDSLEPLAYQLGVDLIKAMNATAKDVESYGKGAIVGVAGELEHGAIWHNPGGAGIRRAIGGGAAGVSGSMKVGPAGTTLDLSIGNVDASNVRSHYDNVSINAGDAPRPDEIVYIVALATGGRPNARLGTLITAEEARAKTKRL